MKLIIDCGSTKADWLLVDKGNVVADIQSEGFNPNYTDEKTISSIVLDNNIHKFYNQDITDIVFYGSGCGDGHNSRMIKGILKTIFTASDVEVFTDMMAACHALLGREKGVACILGTGSNACLYDGKTIYDTAVSLGYIAGDEGSGSHIGKTLLRDYFYGKMPETLSRKFCDEYRTDVKAFVDNVYHKTHTSRYLASFARFAADNMNHDYIVNLCNKCFDEFIDCHILRFTTLPNDEVSFVGSVAYYFKDIITQRLRHKGIEAGLILKSPKEGLLRFHSRG